MTFNLLFYVEISYNEVYRELMWICSFCVTIYTILMGILLENAGCKLCYFVLKVWLQFSHAKVCERKGQKVYKLEGMLYNREGKRNYW